MDSTPPKVAMASVPRGAIQDEPARTELLARQALDKIKQHGLSATPEMFELWFAYHAGQNPTLNGALDGLLSLNGRSRGADLVALYRRFIGAGDVRERTGAAGTSLDGEVFEVSKAFGDALEAASTYGSDLSRVTNLLDEVRTGEDIKSAIIELAGTVSAFKRINAELEERLGSSKRQIQDLRENLQKIQIEAQTDPLTGLLNRRTFDLMLAELLAKHTQEAMCFMMCDVDHFRNFNNQWGHLVGDQVLRLVAGAIRTMFKGQDIVARFGGEEFAIVLPRTSLSAACTVADQLRRQVMSKHIRDRNTGVDMGRVTLSIGIVQAELGDIPESLIGRADACLYFAKRTGRNRVVSQSEILTERHGLSA